MDLLILWIFDIRTYTSLGKIREQRMWLTIKPGSSEWRDRWKFTIWFSVWFNLNKDVYHLKDILFLWIVFSLWRLMKLIFSNFFPINRSNILYSLFRSNYQRCSLRKGIPRNFTEFAGKHLCQSLFLNKVVGLRPFWQSTSGWLFCY